MTIDEAIKDLRYDAQCNRADLDIEWAERNEQLAEWLELLKWYQQGMEDIPSESGVLPKDVYRAGYIKAIDDFLEKIQWEYLNSCGIKQQEIEFLIAISDRVAEQLKEGGVDTLNKYSRCKDCEYLHENGNCLKVGGFYSSVDDKDCVKEGSADNE